MKKLSSDLYWMRSLGGLINAYVWNGDTLLDTGAPALAKIFFHEAKKDGFSPESFRNVLLSHCHIDHAGGLFHMGHAVNVYGSQEDLAVLEGKHEKPGYHPKYGFLVETAERLIPQLRLQNHHAPHPIADGGETQGWRAIVIPGHTPGSICWYQPESRTLFTGDVLINHFNFLSGPAPLFSYDYRQIIASLQPLKELELETVIFGHGIPVTERAEKRIHGLIDRLTAKVLQGPHPA